MARYTSFTFFFVILSALVSVARAEPLLRTYQVADIVPGPRSSAVEKFVAHNGAVYFGALDSKGDNYLWRTDGKTIERLVLLSERSSGFGDPFVSAIFSFGGDLYYTLYPFRRNIGTSSEGNYSQLWRTDGRDKELVGELENGIFDDRNVSGDTGLLYLSLGTTNLSAFDGNSIMTVENHPETIAYDLTTHAGKLYYQTDDGLWAVDGLNASKIGDFQRPNEGAPYALFGDALYVLVPESETIAAFWKLEGETYERTELTLASGEALEVVFQPLGITENAIFFAASTSSFGKEVWSFDGETFARVSNLNDGNPRLFTSAGNSVFFLDDDGRGSQSGELWRTDGVIVKRVKGLYGFPRGRNSPERVPSFFPLGVFKDTLLAFGYTRSIGSEPFRYSDDSFVPVYNIGVGATSSLRSSRFVGPRITFNDLFLFRANDGRTGEELWAISLRE